VIPSRTLGVGLIGVALLGHFAVTRPARQAAAEAADRYQHLRREKRDAARRLADVEKKAEVLARAGELVSAGTPVPRQEAVQRVRNATVKSLQAVGITRVRLVVRPAAPPATAMVGIEAEASFEEQVRLLSQLLRPGSGLVLSRLEVEPGAPLRIRLEAAAIGNPS
jgi:hypothetical protein